MIERKLMAHYIDAGFGGDGGDSYTPNYVRLGKDLEEFNNEMNPDIETSKNILGESTVKHKGYEVSASVDPYYAEKGDPLFEKIQDIVDERLTGDACKTTALDVRLWETATSGAYTAYREDCLVVPNSNGGNTSGYQIPFTIHYAGNRVKGTFNPKTKTFTPSTSD